MQKSFSGRFVQKRNPLLPGRSQKDAIISNLSSFAGSLDQPPSSEQKGNLHSSKHGAGKSKPGLIVKKRSPVHVPDSNRIIPYSKSGQLFQDPPKRKQLKSKTEEDLLNMIKLTPTPLHSAAVSMNDPPKKESPVPSQKALIPDKARIAELEAKLRKSTERFKKVEMSYKKLLVKQFSADRGDLSELDFTKSQESVMQTPSPIQGDAGLTLQTIAERLDRMEQVSLELLGLVRTLVLNAQATSSRAHK